jgi:ABC-type nitrate/sulfonate/bicarbonate transport system substrate-binding protein
MSEKRSDMSEKHGVSLSGNPGPSPSCSPGGLVERRAFLVGSAGIAGFVALAGCGSSGSSSASQSSGGSGTVKSASVSLLLDFLPNVDDVFIAVAEKYGYFADEKLTVATTNPSVAQINSIPELTGLGRFDFGIQSVPVGMFAYKAGAPVLAVAGWGQRAEGIISLPKNKVTGPKSLVGKTVATYNAADYKAFLISFMRSAGLSVSKVNAVNTNFTPPVIASGRAYAGLGIKWGELIDTESYAKGPVDFLPFYNGSSSPYGIPQMNYLLLFTAKSYAARNGDIVKRMVRALARGYKKAYLLSNSELSPIMNTWCSTGPNKTGDLPTNMKKFNAGRSVAFYGSNQDPHTATYFQQPLRSLPVVANWLESTGVVKSLGNLSSFATNAYLTPGALHPSV